MPLFYTGVFEVYLVPFLMFTIFFLFKYFLNTSYAVSLLSRFRINSGGFKHFLVSSFCAHLRSYKKSCILSRVSRHSVVGAVSNNIFENIVLS